MIVQYFSSFYDFARRKLDIKPSTVDEYLAAHATASIDGRVIELRYSDHVTYGRVGLGHTKHATEWVNKFNDRAT